RAARTRDHARIYRAAFGPVNGRRLMWGDATRSGMLTTDWCAKRDQAIDAAKEALQRLHDVLNRSTADPGLLGLSFQGVELELQRFLREARGPEAPDESLYQGRGRVLRMLLSATPTSLGWTKGGRPRAVWQREAKAAFRGLK